ncbi:MAG: hypothetical protein KAI73_05060 [Rhodospirillaceae bacterium]|nr:hypothetical protein [Rhodospirillaceae bacterium]
MADDTEQRFGLFSPETGTKVQRFGAALSGRLPEFDVAAQTRQEELSAERKKAFLLDNRGALRLLRGGNTQGAVDLLRNRVGEINRLGGDATQSTQLLAMAEAGETEALISGLQTIDNRAVDAGIFDALPGSEDVALVVKSSDILPDGTVIQSTSEGVRVIAATGEQLHGQDVVDAIEKGRKFGVTIAGDTAAAKAEADRVKQGIRISGEMFKQVGPIRQSLLTIGKARQALAEGAETGAIDKFLPDLRESSIKLTNLMNQLGLEVISGATFGALSAGELRLALDTALPTGLQPEALDKWLADKGLAQTKLLTELQDDIIFLSNGGTIAGIVQRRRAQAETTPPSVDKPIDQLTDEELLGALRQ